MPQLQLLSSPATFIGTIHPFRRLVQRCPIPTRAPNCGFSYQSTPKFSGTHTSPRLKPSAFRSSPRRSVVFSYLFQSDRFCRGRNVDRVPWHSRKRAPKQFPSPLQSNPHCAVFARSPTMDPMEHMSLPRANLHFFSFVKTPPVHVTLSARPRFTAVFF